MRDWREWSWIVALGLALAILAGLTVRQERRETAPPYSTHLAAGRGLAGIYEALGAERPRPLRWNRPPAELPAGVERFVVWHPTVAMTQAEWQAIRRWAAAGHTAILALSPAALSQLAELTVTAGGERVQAEASPVRLAPWTAGVSRVEGGAEPPAGVRWHRQVDTYLADDAGHPAAVGWAEGKGQVIVFLDPDWLTNDRVTLAGNPRMAFRLLTGPGRTAFSEWHHGFRAPAPAGAAGLGPWWAALLQAGLCLAVLLLYHGARFGSPYPVPAQTPRHTAEFALAMGNLYRQARARPAVAAALRRRLLGLLRRLGAPGHADPATLGRLYAARTGQPPDELVALLAELDPGRAPREADLAPLARRAELLQRRMEHGLERRRGS